MSNYSNWDFYAEAGWEPYIGGSQLTNERVSSPKQLNTEPSLPLSTEIPHYTKAHLKNNGWTDKLILDFLGKPDFHLRNPRNFKYPICCYEKTRVDSVRESPECSQAFEWRHKIGSRIRKGHAKMQNADIEG